MSQADYETTTIEDVQYRVRMLDPLVSNDLLLDVLAAVGPALGALAPQAIDKGIDGFLDDDDAGPAVERAIAHLVKGLDKAKVRELINTMASVTEFSTDGSKWPRLQGTFTIHFRGELGRMYKWLFFAMKVQWRPFFRGAGSRTDLAGRISDLLSPDQTQST